MGFTSAVGGDHLRDRFDLNRVNDGADVDALVQWVAHAQFVHPGAQFRVKRLSHGLMHQKPRPGTAHLPLIEPDRVDQSFDCAVQIRVVKHNVGGFPAQL